MTDAELLRAYAGGRSEEAFRALVERYVRLVYGACWRQLGDRHLAEDATQGVFVLLSQRAGQLRRGRVAGWLLTAARYACANIRKVQQRRKRREQVVAMLQQTRAREGGDDELLAILDEGLGRLGAADREALVLRYLQEQPLREVGQALGVSEEAARKRVDRGLDKLRRYFVRRGVAASSAALAAVLAAEAKGGGLTPQAQESMSQGIVQACQAAAAEGGVGVGAGVAKGIEAMMAMAKLKVAALVVAVLAAGMGATWVVMTQVGANGAGQNAVVPATAPATGGVAEVVVDLSTPEKALESLVQALKAADRKKTYQCMGVDVNRRSKPVDGSMAINLGLNRLVAVAMGAFGEEGAKFGQGIITLDMAVELLKDAMMVLGQQVSIEGDTAVLVIDVPEAGLRLMPQEIQDLARQWMGRMLRFRKVGETWVVDLERSIRPTVKFLGPGQKELEIKDDAGLAVFLGEWGEAMEKTAEEIEDGKLGTFEEARRAMDGRVQTLLGKYGKFTGAMIGAAPVSDEEAGVK